jgi:putative PIN family toxin of toxin-antitoxin system
MFVVLDTNVIVSAFINPLGSPARVMRLILENPGPLNQLKFCYNLAIIDEYEGVISRPKFASSVDKNKARRFIDLLTASGISHTPVPGSIAFQDESDRIFYDTAKTSGAVLVTGNLKHYPKEAFIMNPAEFLSYLNI